MMKPILIYKFQNVCSMIQVFKRFQEKTMMNYWSSFPKNLHPLLFSQVLINPYSKEQKMIWLIILLIKILSKLRLLFERYQIATSKLKRKNLCLNSLFESQTLGLMELLTQSLNPHRDRKMIRSSPHQGQKKFWWLKLSLIKCFTIVNKETFKIKLIHLKHSFEYFSYAQDLME